VRLSLAIVLAITMVGLMPTMASAQSSGAFTSAESRRLRRGELVVRPESRRRGGLLLIGGTSFQIIDQPPEVVWAAVRDTRAYAHFLPQVDGVRLVDRGSRGQGRVIRVTHREGPIEGHYYLRLDFANTIQTVQFRIDAGRDNDVRDGWGYIKVQPYGNGRSMVTWAILADIGSGIAVGLVRGEIRAWILAVPRLLSNYLDWASGRYTD
jgi:carbon monoxide dehydrogenase subunit G